MQTHHLQASIFNWSGSSLSQSYHCTSIINLNGRYLHSFVPGGQNRTAPIQNNILARRVLQLRWGRTVEDFMKMFKIMNNNTNVAVNTASLSCCIQLDVGRKHVDALHCAHGSLPWQRRLRDPDTKKYCTVGVPGRIDWWKRYTDQKAKPTL